MKPLRKRIMKRKLQRFWNEWGLTKEDFINLFGLTSIFIFLFAAYIVLTVFI